MWNNVMIFKLVYCNYGNVRNGEVQQRTTEERDIPQSIKRRKAKRMVTSFMETTI
jgi:hypothetical protein